MKNSSLAGIVVYKPDDNLVELVNNLIKQKVDIFLFINKSNSISDKLIKEKNLDHTFIGSNVGISEGLNFIIKRFLKSSYDFLFTFDQDSMINNHFINEMLNTFMEAIAINGDIICCSPTVLDIKFPENKNLIFMNRNHKRDFQYINFAITSGSLFIKSSFKRVGLMNEKLFIDGVDTDWCERALLANCKLIKANGIFINHKIGIKYINFFGLKKSYHDQDLRVYYIVRNSLYLLFFGKNTFRWKRSELIRTIIRLIAYPLLSSTKFKTLFYICLAFKDFFKKNMGKMDYLEH